MSARGVGFLVFIFSASMFVSTSSFALSIGYEMVEVPIDRAIKNLEEQIAEPGDRKYQYSKVNLKLALARLHAMAYGVGLDKANICKTRDKSQFGLCGGVQIQPFLRAKDPEVGVDEDSGKRQFPRKPLVEADPKSAQPKDVHLQRAIELYKAVLQDPNAIEGIDIATLGLAWTLEHAGKTSEAVSKYRELLGRSGEYWSKSRTEAEDTVDLGFNLKPGATKISVVRKDQGKADVEVLAGSLVSLLFKKSFENLYVGGANLSGKIASIESDLASNNFENASKRLIAIAESVDEYSNTKGEKLSSYGRSELANSLNDLALYYSLSPGKIRPPITEIRAAKEIADCKKFLGFDSLAEETVRRSDLCRYLLAERKKDYSLCLGTGADYPQLTEEEYRCGFYLAVRSGDLSGTCEKVGKSYVKVKPKIGLPDFTDACKLGAERWLGSSPEAKRQSMRKGIEKLTNSDFSPNLELWLRISIGVSSFEVQMVKAENNRYDRFSEPQLIETIEERLTRMRKERGQESGRLFEEPGKRSSKFTLRVTSNDGKILGKADGSFKFQKSLNEYPVAKPGYIVSKAVGKFLDAEAAERLIALLDKEKDKVEIEKYKTYIFRRELIDDATPRAISPLAIPLKAGLTRQDMILPSSRVKFDLEGTGLSSHWEWIAPEAAWIAYKPKKSPMSGLFLFGNITFFAAWPDGYAALCSLDDNHDGELAGQELSNIVLWNDRNADGKTQDAEYIELAAAGVEALSCGSEAGEMGEVWNPKGARLRNGAYSPTFDLILRSR